MNDLLYLLVIVFFIYMSHKIIGAIEVHLRKIYYVIQSIRYAWKAFRIIGACQKDDSIPAEIKDIIFDMYNRIDDPSLMKNFSDHVYKNRIKVDGDTLSVFKSLTNTKSRSLVFRFFHYFILSLSYSCGEEGVLYREKINNRAGKFLFSTIFNNPTGIVSFVGASNIIYNANQESQKSLGRRVFSYLSDVALGDKYPRVAVRETAKCLALRKAEVKSQSDQLALAHHV